MDPLRTTCSAKVKQNSVKQEFEKQDELKRSALRVVVALLAIPDAGENYSAVTHTVPHARTHAHRHAPTYTWVRWSGS